MLMQFLLPQKTVQQIFTKKSMKYFYESYLCKEMKQIIRSLHPKKTSGHDNPSLHLFKLIAEQMSLSIAIFINKSLSEGIVPDVK